MHLGCIFNGVIFGNQNLNNVPILKHRIDVTKFIHLPNKEIFRFHSQEFFYRIDVNSLRTVTSIFRLEELFKINSASLHIFPRSKSRKRINREDSIEILSKNICTILSLVGALGVDRQRRMALTKIFATRVLVRKSRARSHAGDESESSKKGKNQSSLNKRLVTDSNFLRSSCWC